MNKLFTTAALVFTLGATALSPALAQTTDQSGPMPGMMGGGCPMMSMMGQGMMGQGMMGDNQTGMAAMVDGRLAYLKGMLNVTDAQTDAWNGYAEAAKSRVGDMRGMHQGMMAAMQKGSATDRMDARIKNMEAMVEAMKTMKPATEKLYAVLTADQKKTADQLIGMDCGAM